MNLRNRWFILLLIGSCFFSSPLCAEIVTEVGADGALTLESGKRVALVGIRMDDEGVSVLRVLVRKQDVKLQLIAGSAPGATELAYAYLQAKYLKFPTKLNQIPDEHEVLINEFLVKLGSAKVIETQDFRYKAKFLKVQAEARKKGEGVWSYEIS